MLVMQRYSTRRETPDELNARKKMVPGVGGEGMVREGKICFFMKTHPASGNCRTRGLFRDEERRRAAYGNEQDYRQPIHEFRVAGQIGLARLARRCNRLLTRRH